MSYESLRAQALAGKALPTPEAESIRQAARDEIAAEEWRRLVEIEKSKLLGKEPWTRTWRAGPFIFTLTKSLAA